jgi:hypothetical protein
MSYAMNNFLGLHILILFNVNSSLQIHGRIEINLIQNMIKGYLLNIILEVRLTRFLIKQLRQLKIPNMWCLGKIKVKRRLKKIGWRWRI